MKQLLPGIVIGLLVLAGIAVLPAIWRGTSPFLDEEGDGGLVPPSLRDEPGALSRQSRTRD